MRCLFILMGCFFVASCTSAWDGSYTNPKFGFWTGKNIHELTSAWGRPDRIATAFNGNWEYMYAARNLRKSPAENSRTMNFAGPKNTNIGINVPALPGGQAGQPVYCVAVFQVNPNNVILNVREEGNYCTGTLVWPGQL